MEEQRMSKRIDLTQFKSISKGPWECIDASTINADITITGDGVGHIDYPQRGTIVSNAPGIREDYLGTFVGENGLNDAQATSMLPDLITELKKMYAREDELLDALRVIKEDLEAVIRQGYIPQRLAEYLTKIRNFANDAAL
jgi:hypothetical protein